MRGFYRGVEQRHPTQDAQAFPDRGFALWRAALTQNIGNLFQVGILFLLTSAPILTLPAAYKALSEVCIIMLRDRAMPSITRAYFGAFRREFLRSTVAGIAVMLSIAALVMLSYRVTSVVVHAVIVALSALLVLWFWCYVSLLISVSQPNSVRIKNACLLVPLHIGSLLLMLALFSLVIFLGIQLFPIPGALIILLLPAPLTLTINHICYGAVRRFVLPSDDAEESNLYGHQQI